MEPVKYITSSTTKIEVGMSFPSVETLSEEWDKKSKYKTTNQEPIDNKKRITWQSEGNGMATYREIDKTTDKTKPYTAREFYVEKINKSYDFYDVFECYKYTYDHDLSTFKNNTVFDTVRIGNQCAYDKNRNGVVDEGEISIMDKSIEDNNDGYRRLFDLSI